MTEIIIQDDYGNDYKIKNLKKMISHHASNDNIYLWLKKNYSYIASYEKK